MSALGKHRCQSGGPILAASSFGRGEELARGDELYLLLGISSPSASKWDY